MKINTLFFMVSCCCLCVATLSWATQNQPVAFSAEIVRHDAVHQDSSSSGMVYVGRDGIRTETSKDRQPVWMIFKPNQKIVWTLFPKQRMYMERAGLSLEWPPLPEDKNSPCRSKNFVCQKTGAQKIGNRSVIHWKIEIITAKGKTFYAQLWVDPRLNIAIREVYADGLTVEMRNIREAPQEARLFELPAGYQRLALPTSGKTAPQARTTAR